MPSGKSVEALTAEHVLGDSTDIEILGVQHIYTFDPQLPDLSLFCLRAALILVLVFADYLAQLIDS